MPIAIGNIRCTICGGEILPTYRKGTGRSNEKIFFGYDWMGHKCSRVNKGYKFIPSDKPVAVEAIPEQFRGLLPKLADNQRWHIISQTRGNTQVKLGNVSLESLGRCSYQVQSNGYHHIISKSGHTIVCTIVFKSPPELYWQDRDGNSLEP